jgi:phosphoenolpyruvate-protein kinase (PTS system EI component)
MNKNMHMWIMKLLMVFSVCCIVVQQCAMQAGAASTQCLRPAAGRSGPVVTRHAIADSLKASSGGESSHAQEAVLYGTGLGVNQTAFGKAAIVSAYSTTKLLRGIKPEEVALELRKLDTIHRVLAEDIKNITEDKNGMPVRGSDIEDMLVRLQAYCNQVKQYYNKLHGEDVVSSVEAMLDFLIDHDVELAVKTDNIQEAALIRLMQESLESYLRYRQPLVESAPDTEAERTLAQQQQVERRAQEEWARVVEAGESLKRLYAKLEDEQRMEQKNIKDKMAALTRRIAEINALSRPQDSLEQQARTSRAKQHQDVLVGLEKALEQSKNQEDVYMVSGLMLDDAIYNAVQSATHMAEHNTTATACIYNMHIRPMEKKLASMDTRDRMYTKIMEGLRTAQDLVGHLNNLEHIRLDTIAGTDALVLFTDHEIGVAKLLRLLSSYNITGIVTTAGNIGTHWVVVATGKGVPVLILNKQDIAEQTLDELAGLGDDSIIEMRSATNQSSVTIRPGQASRIMYEVASRKQELETKFFLQEILKEHAHSPKGIPIAVYGNVAEESEIESVVAGGGQGIGLVRTEIALDRHNTILKSYIESVVSGSDVGTQKAYRDLFFYEYTSDMLQLFLSAESMDGPVVIRTFDIAEDKAKDILDVLPQDQRKTGFEFYKTDIGRRILVTQLSAIMNAYYIFMVQQRTAAGVAQSAPKPQIIFPMVKTAEEAAWATQDVVQEALKYTQQLVGLEEETQLRIGQASQVSLEFASDQLQFGIMAETIESVNNLDAILQNDKVHKISIGTNDLTQAVLMQMFNIVVSRDDSYFGKFFFELVPGTLDRIEAVAQAVSRWNQAHPENEKTVTVCGALAGRKEFLLFAAYLQTKYNIPISVSVPAGIIAPLRYFRTHIRPEDIKFFNDPFGFSTEHKAATAVRAIDERIEHSPAYQMSVNAALSTMRALFDSLPLATSSDSDSTLSILQQIETAA